MTIEKLKYFALDIETTGLDWNRDQIIQVAVVFDDGVTALESLKRTVFDVYHDRYEGDAFALAMNKPILERLAKVTRNNAPYDDSYHAGDTIQHSMMVNTIINNFTVRCLESFFGADGQPIKPTFAGKNIGSFDLRFIEQYQQSMLLRHHRTIDVGSLFIRETDQEPPSLNECLVRAGFDKQVTHDAESDCLDVIRCIRAYWRKEV